MVAQLQQWTDHGLKTVGSVFPVSQRPDLRDPSNLLSEDPDALSRVSRDQGMTKNSGVASFFFGGE
jgi:hypothetical protein